MTITDKAKMYSDMFVTDTRNDGQPFVKYTDDATQELKDSVRKAHGDRFPDDWIYSTYAGLLEKITDYSIDDIDGLEDVSHEIVDGYVDIYTSDLTKWLNEDNRNVYYLTQALEEFRPTDGFKLLEIAQYCAINDVMTEIIELLRGEYDN